LNLVIGDTFSIRDFVRNKRDKNTADFSVVSFTYTAGGANDQTNPPDWHLTDFNTGASVTIVAADGQPGTGNHGDARYRIYALRNNQTKFDDHMTIRVTNNSADRTNVEGVQCSVPAPDEGFVEAEFNSSNLPSDLAQQIADFLEVNRTQIEVHIKGSCAVPASNCVTVEIEFRTEHSGKDAREMTTEFVFRLNDADSSITDLGFKAGTAIQTQPSVGVTTAVTTAAQEASASALLGSLWLLASAALLSL